MNENLHPFVIITASLTAIVPIRSKQLKF